MCSNPYRSVLCPALAAVIGWSFLSELAGCDRKPARPASEAALREAATPGQTVPGPTDTAAADTQAADAVAADSGPRRPMPAYRFAEGLRAEHPQIVSFLRQFLETCLANDYSGYRKLVSRQIAPESQQRFESIYRAITSVVVERIEKLDDPRLPEPIYRVISSVALDPESKVRLRKPNRKIAILVVHESGAWRMVPAPETLQPRAEPERPATTAPTPATQPAYPWDEDGDD